jgi:predicted NAD/FAD-binding protein
MQGRNNCYFAGAWTGYGFHEDGLSSGLKVATALGAVLPWSTIGGAEDIEPELDAVA